MINPYNHIKHAAHLNYLRQRNYTNLTQLYKQFLQLKQHLNTLRYTQLNETLTHAFETVNENQTLFLSIDTHAAPKTKLLNDLNKQLQDIVQIIEKDFIPLFQFNTSTNSILSGNTLFEMKRTAYQEKLEILRNKLHLLQLDLSALHASFYKRTVNDTLEDDSLLQLLSTTTTDKLALVAELEDLEDIFSTAQESVDESTRVIDNTLAILKNHPFDNY